MNLLGQIDDLISAELEKWEIPGIAVGLMQGKTVETAGFGVANLATGAKVTPETLFQIGSISKVFTTSLLMTFIDAGKLDLDTPVVTYLPTLKLLDTDAMQQITLRHLVTHTSGFYGDRFDDHGSGDDALARAVAALADLPQQTAPGELWTYCNAGFDLAGRVMEVTARQPFEAIMRERLFEPLGLPYATHFAAEAIRHAVAVGHNHPEGGWEVANPWPIPRRSSAAGGISATVGELLQFARMHLDGGKVDRKSILSQQAADAMMTHEAKADYGRNWGLGWSLRNVDGVKLAEHSGGTNGFAARLTVIPERDFALAVLTNNSHGSQAHAAILSIAMDRLLGIRAPSSRSRSLKPGEIETYSGRFEHGLARVEITVAGDRAVLKRETFNPFAPQWTKQQDSPVERIERDVLTVTNGDAKGMNIEYLRDKNREIRFLRVGGRLAYPVKDGRKRRGSATRSQ